jgi:proteasome lid subunit RPN8/RPN11
MAGQIIITNETLRKSGMNGQYDKVALRDYTTESVASFPIDINVEPKNTGLRLILILLLAAIIIGGGAMYFINKKKSETRKAYLAKAKALQQSQKVQQIPTHNIEPQVTESPKIPKKITISKSERKFVPANSGSDFVSSGRMKITKRDVKGGRKTAEEFTEILKGDKYAYMDLQELWPDTAIRELFLSKKCIKALGSFLKEENLDKVITEMEGAIPEVGGFLMGYHQLDEATGSIRVTMDQFVPFVPEYHDVFKIEIGTATLVQELGDAQDNHPDKDVIGWFHTHPGHGLFLSNSDLSVQRHFPLKFQIAMEIDSLTESLDTAFFTRKNNGTINNVEHRRKGAKWFSWKKIENI